MKRPAPGRVACLAVTAESFAQAWSTVVALAPERIAIVCGERRITFGEFGARANALARSLHDDGLRPGDKVAIELVNSPEYLETFFATQLLGCVPVNVNYRYVEAELAYLFDNSDAAAVVYHDEFASTVASASAMRATQGPLARYQVHHFGAEHARGTALEAGVRDYEAASRSRCGRWPGPAPCRRPRATRSNVGARPRPCSLRAR